MAKILSITTTSVTPRFTLVYTKQPYLLYLRDNDIHRQYEIECHSQIEKIQMELWSQDRWLVFINSYLAGGLNG